MNLTGFVKKLKIYLQEENKVKKWMKRLKNERGLTLVELLAVIVILAIIGTIAFVMIGNIIENSKKDAHIANAQQLIAAAKLYDADQGIEGGSISSDALHTEGFLDPLVDPWGEGEYSGTVNKDGTEYTVTINGEGCTISGANEVDLAGDRDEVCGSES